MAFPSVLPSHSPGDGVLHADAGLHDLQHLALLGCGSRSGSGLLLLRLEKTIHRGREWTLPLTWKPKPTTQRDVSPKMIYMVSSDFCLRVYAIHENVKKREKLSFRNQCPLYSKILSPIQRLSTVHSSYFLFQSTRLYYKQANMIVPPPLNLGLRCWFADWRWWESSFRTMDYQ